MITYISQNQNYNVKIRPVRTAILREEFFELTQDHKAAIILNQCMLWTQQSSNFDLFLQEEQQRSLAFDISLKHGFFRKSYDEINDECMLDCRIDQIASILSNLIENKWLERRDVKGVTPYYTYEYRVNLLNIQKELMQNGYVLSDHTMGKYLSDFGQAYTRENGLKLEQLLSEFSIIVLDGRSLILSEELGQKLLLFFKSGLSSNFEAWKQVCINFITDKPLGEISDLGNYASFIEWLIRDANGLKLLGNYILIGENQGPVSHKKIKETHND